MSVESTSRHLYNLHAHAIVDHAETGKLVGHLLQELYTVGDGVDRRRHDGGSGDDGCRQGILENITLAACGGCGVPKKLTSVVKRKQQIQTKKKTCLFSSRNRSLRRCDDYCYRR